MDEPYLDSGVKGYIINTARKNYWRVAAWYEFDDLLQDGYVVWAKCRRQFRADPNKPPAEEQRRFMAYFKMAFHNQILDLYKKSKSCCETNVASLTEQQEQQLEHNSGVDLSDVHLAALLARAPAEVLDLLKKLLVEDVAGVPYRRTRLHPRKNGRLVKGRRARRETTSEHLDRCVGTPGVAEQLLNYIRGV